MPEFGIGTREFQRHMKFSSLSGRDDLDNAFAHLIGPRVSQGEDLAWIQRGSRFHERAMRIYNDRLRRFVEGGIVRQTTFQVHGRLDKEPLAAPPSLRGVHYAAPFANRANFHSLIIMIL